MMDTKEHFIEIFRANGFNCFPIPKYADRVEKQKHADSRYAAEKTPLNQEIRKDENYGVIAIEGKGTCFIDFDNKEIFREFAEQNIENGYMVIESPNGWHIPVKGLTGEIKKTFFYEKIKNADKQIIEIQGPKHYVVGCGSDVWNPKANPPRRMYYENRGSEKIWDAKGGDFDTLVDTLCRVLNVKTERKGASRNQQYEMRVRFKKGLPPTPGTSNDYFFNAAIQCLTDKISQDDAIKKIRTVFDKWEKPTRAWSNILAKIKDAYENGEPLKEGRPKKKDDDEDPVKILVERFLIEKKLYSDEVMETLYENQSGFLEDITARLHKQCQSIYEDLTLADLNDVRFKLIGLSPDLPETNKDLIVFDNGVYDKKKKALIITEDIADMGFKGYKYLEPTKENEPTEFIKMAFDNVPDHEHPRLKIALKSALTPKLDPRMTVIHGESRTGKSTLMNVLLKVLNKGEKYGMTLEMSQLLGDNFHKAEIHGKTFVNLTDLPTTYSNFDAIKALTGEETKRERKFHEAPIEFDNKIKIIATANKLAKIPEEHQDAMYAARLSLVHFIKTEKYEENPDFATDIVKKEGEKILSWILNIPDEECAYEDKKTLKREWEQDANPFLEYLTRNYQYGDPTEPFSVASMRRDFMEKYQTVIPMKEFIATLEEEGYNVYKMQITNIIPLPKQTEAVPEGQEQIE